MSALIRKSAVINQSGGLADQIALAATDNSIYRPGVGIFRRPAGLSGISFTGQTGAAAKIVQRNGVSCIEMAAADTGSGLIIASLPITSGLQDGNVQYVFEFEDAANWNGGGPDLRFYSDGAFNVGMRCGRTIGSGSGWSGIQVVTPTDSEWSAIGGGSFAATTMTYAQLRFVMAASPPAGAGKRVWIYSLERNARRSLPRVFLGADDGDASWYTDGLPVLEKYNLKSYLAYIHDSALAGGASMTAAQWQDAIVARGHDAVVHGCKLPAASLRDYFTAHPGYATAYDAIFADIAYNRDGMIAAGLDPTGRGRTVYVLPQGYHQPAGGAGDSTIASALTAAGMKVCRLAATNLGCTSIVIGPAYAHQAMYLAIVGHGYAGAGEAANIAAIIALIQSEVARGRDIILMFHRVKASPTLATDISPANLDAICLALATLINSGAALQGSMLDLPLLFSREAQKALA